MRDDFELADFLPKAGQAFVAVALDFSDQPANAAGVTRLIQILLWQVRTVSLWRVALAQEAHNAACALEHQGEWQIGLRKIRSSDKFELTLLNVGLEILEADAFILRDLIECCRLGRAADPSACWPHWLVTLIMGYRQRLLDWLADAVIDLADDEFTARTALDQVVGLNFGWVVTLGANDRSDFVESAWQAGQYRRQTRFGHGPTERRTRLTRLWQEEEPFEPNKLLMLV